MQTSLKRKKAVRSFAMSTTIHPTTPSRPTSLDSSATPLRVPQTSPITSCCRTTAPRSPRCDTQ